MSEINHRVPDRVRVSEGITKNLGDFNSFRYDVSVEFNVAEGESLEEAFERGYRQVDAEVEKRLAQVEADLED